MIFFQPQPFPQEQPFPQQQQFNVPHQQVPYQQQQQYSEQQMSSTIVAAGEPVREVHPGAFQGPKHEHPFNQGPKRLQMNGPMNQPYLQQEQFQHFPPQQQQIQQNQHFNPQQKLPTAPLLDQPPPYSP